VLASWSHPNALFEHARASAERVCLQGTQTAYATFASNEAQADADRDTARAQAGAKHRVRQADADILHTTQLGVNDVGHTVGVAISHQDVFDDLTTLVRDVERNPVEGEAGGGQGLVQFVASRAGEQRRIVGDLARAGGPGVGKPRESGGDRSGVESYASLGSAGDALRRDSPIAAHGTKAVPGFNTSFPGAAQDGCHAKPLTKQSPPTLLSVQRRNGRKMGAGKQEHRILYHAAPIMPWCG
jgi:hypothetical protein